MMIERVTHRLLPYGPVLVVTDDHAEQDTVSALGGMTATCENFIRMVGDALGDLQADVNRHNHRERKAFGRSRE